jgi:hypothetical protein
MLLKFEGILSEMNPLDLAKGWLVDLWHLPIPFQLMLLFMAGMWVRDAWKRRMQRQLENDSLSWPVREGRVIWAQVAKETKAQGRRRAPVWMGVLTYSYFVSETEVGEYRRPFQIESEADEWARSLHEKTVRVRVDPNDPTRSVWLAEEAKAAIANAKMAVPKPPRELSPVWQLIRFATLVASVLGAMGALWIHVTYLAGRSIVTSDSSWFFAFHFAAIGCAILSSLVMSRRYPGSFGRTSEWFARGNARTVLKVLGVYTGAVFIYGWVRGAAHLSAHQSFDPTGMFSAVWLTFFVSSAFACWAVESDDLSPITED